MHALTAFARNDARNMRRDSLLLYMLALPYALVILARWMVPGITAWVAARFAFDLVPYYPLMVSLMFVLQAPMMFGIVIGLMILDERDADTLTALRVTPLPLLNYALYRLGLIMALATGFVIVATPLTGLVPLSVLPALVVIGLGAGLFGAATGLFLATFAANKVEGIALMKVTGIFLVWPVVAYFLPAAWQPLLGLVPTYWLAKAVWVASAGGTYSPYVLVGVVYMLALLLWLLRRFQARLYR